MIIDNVTIICSCIILVFAIVSSLLANPFFRRLKPQKKETDSAETHPKVSVVVVSNGTAEQMDAHLSSILTQDYAYGFEVIVVTTQKESQTGDVLKRYASAPNLYTTFIPGQSLFMSRAKLAITIGVKAAHNEWVLVTDSRYTPVSDKWIEAMARNCQNGTDMVIGYTNYDIETSPYKRFERLKESAYLMRKAAKGRALGAKGSNIMFRKSQFIKEDGFRGNLQFVHGEYDFLVNKYADRYSVAVELDKDAWLIEDEPTNKTWRSEQMGFINYRKHMKGILSYRALHITDTLLAHLNYWCIIALGAYGGIIHNWIIAGAAAVALIMTFALRTIVAHKAYSDFEASIPTWRTVFYELRSFWNGVANRLAYLRADKHDFTSHKL